MDLLIPHTGTVIWMLIAFSTILFLLKKFAWKPILGALKQREDSIENALKAADAAKEEMAKLQADNEKILADARKDRDSILKEARDLKDSIINDAKIQASEEAQKIIDSAKDNIKLEKESAIKDIKEHAVGLSIYIAEKLLKEKLTTDKEQQELIDKLMRDIKMN